MRADYAMASENRFRRQRAGVSALGGPGDWHFKSEADFIRSREYVRDMVRNDVAIGPTIDKAVQQQIQNGFRLDPDTGDKALDLDLWHRWNAWATNADQCDMSGEDQFSDMEAQVFDASLVDGDILAIGTREGQLQIVEADRLRTPTRYAAESRRNIQFGVEMDDYRRHLRYYIAKDSVGESRKYQRLYDFDPIEARDSSSRVRQAFHVHVCRKRKTMTRGVTALKAVVDVATMFDDTNFALAVKQQFAAALVWFMKRGPGFQQRADRPMGSRSYETLADGTRKAIENIEPGQYIEGDPGEELELKASGIQSTDALQHLRFLLQLLGMNLGLPLVLVLLDARETNFSGWRAAMDMARLGFKTNQQRLIRRFHAPVYRFKQQQWIEQDPALARSAARLGERFFAHRWHTPTWPYINPLDDVKANTMRISGLQASERQVAAEDGRDFDDIIDEHLSDRVRTIGKSIKAASKLSKKFGVPITWRDVLNQDMPKGGTIQDSTDMPNADQQQTAQPQKQASGTQED